ncbi:FGGY family carbohydrate kinase [Microvirga sp. TS319]|uniref:FGGY family carbohydrate kinase n=1 Tax=Microvirga sp. TS319 TaxID=3241165 RepID=UPI00351A39FD
MASPLILAIDQGTSSTKVLLVDRAGVIRARGQASIGQATPNPGWVEQDPSEIWDSVRRAVAETVTPEVAAHIVGVGLSTQRESCVVWDRRTGEPLSPVLSWQDQRTALLCEAIRGAGQSQQIRRTTGLPLDPMFSAAKAKWILDRIDPDRARARRGELVVGTIDAFLLSRLGGEPLIEAGNASRTQLVDVQTCAFDPALLDLFGVPEGALPRIVPSTGPFPTVANLLPLLDGTPVLSVLADSHSALFAHGAFEPGPVKATQGTGSSVMGLLGPVVAANPDRLHAGICRTIAWWVDVPALAFEGNIRSAGSTLVWAADLLGIDPAGLARLAAATPSAGNVHLVPGFNGLGAPWWDSAAVGCLSGVTLGSGRGVVARAALDSIAHQIADVIDAVRDSGVPVSGLMVDGGPTRNEQLVQFEADMVGLPVFRTETAELSALGTAHLAGLQAGLFSLSDLAGLERPGRTFMPAQSEADRRSARAAWLGAVRRARLVPELQQMPDHQPAAAQSGRGGN